MLLLKQARAFGLGVVLATQNPVDLDYKALSNTGTWFIGRLQTERDKARVLEGLTGASGDGAFDSRQISDVLSGLGSRVFLMHNVHERAPVTFETRWTLSYLRGPLTRTHIKRLTAGNPPSPEASARHGQEPGTGYRVPDQAAPPSDLLSTPPVLPPGIPSMFVPPRGVAPSGATTS